MSHPFNPLTSLPAPGDVVFDAALVSNYAFRHQPLDSTEGGVPFSRLPDIATAFDPLAWAQNAGEFWRASRLVEPSGLDFTPVVAPPVPGAGYAETLFHEVVEFAMDGGLVDGFDNILRMYYAVRPQAQLPASEADYNATYPGQSLVLVDMRFALYLAESSLVLSRIAPGGVDRDFGYFRATLTGAHGGKALVAFEAGKSLRFHSLSDQAVDLGAGAAYLPGQVLNFVGPSLLELFLDFTVRYAIAHLEA